MGMWQILCADPTIGDFAWAAYQVSPIFRSIEAVLIWLIKLVI
jgi:hypothetical protein